MLKSKYAMYVINFKAYLLFAPSEMSKIALRGLIVLFLPQYKYNIFNACFISEESELYLKTLTHEVQILSGKFLTYIIFRIIIKDRKRVIFKITLHFRVICSWNYYILSYITNNCCSQFLIWDQLLNFII